MKYWLDTEFIEDGKTIELISIGIVCEDGREYYAVNADCDLTKASDWVKENVIKQLPPRPQLIEHAIAFDMPMIMNRLSVWRPRFVITAEVFGFCDPQNFGKPEFWGYYADYDWVVFCQLFGTMMDLPKGFPMYMRDIKQLCDDLGNPKLPTEGKGEHNALCDAQWNKTAYEFLIEIQRKQVA